MIHLRRITPESRTHTSGMTSHFYLLPDGFTDISNDVVQRQEQTVCHSGWPSAASPPPETRPRTQPTNPSQEQKGFAAGRAVGGGVPSSLHSTQSGLNWH